jgi:TldD protein
MHRRTFLKTSALTGTAALAGLSVGARTVSAAEVRRHGADTSAYGLLADPLAPDQLRRLATVALDVARTAGAQYADVRCAHVQQFSVSLDPTGVPVVGLKTYCSYGVRVMVNGAFAFDYGTVASEDAIAIAARNAVTQAKGFATVVTGVTGGELAPAPAVQGEWVSEVQIDPFSVPVLEQGALLGALGAATSGRSEGTMAGALFRWARETRVCATTEGTRTTQTFTRAHPSIGVGAIWFGSVNFLVPETGPRLAGYEYVAGQPLQERIKRSAELAARYARLHTRVLDIGRYPAVFDGEATASLLNHTLGPALQFDCVLGLEADASGSSFLAPPAEILGAPLFSPKLSVVASRPETDITGVKWDDEGVAPSPTPISVITDGRVVDYLTDRGTAPALRAWYDKQRIPYASHGFAVTRRADRPVVVGTGHLSMVPSANSASVDDLLRGMKHGVLVLRAPSVSTDQRDSLMLEVKNGVVTNRVKQAGLQFKTTAFWKGVDAIGDASTLGAADAELSKGQPWQGLQSTGRAPAIRCTAVDIIQVQNQ